MDASGLPFQSAPVDHLRCGFSSFETAQSSLHPIQTFEKSRVNNEWGEKLMNAKNMYGTHMAMRLATERQQFTRDHRLFGLPSSRIGLDSVTGEGIQIEYSDFLNDPHMRPEAPKVTLHDVMEVKLNLV
mmetsp:Transcript_22966/g.38878  ORF Transcript_22966/g.38878 Transcript_22966/m.38878 type:complete len:129 (+) Transcript_22966:93-479(+)|eukprot:CAMPEP_0114424212 /NCGR_PEP_ID=MMETSP0103-20121206/6571_1 /TAXON_ID=37642 ORGANISM="Paraphysomonas imperforata, Strain PA2" /NCGR_SAMPLE_ID=MMETSP0103 /ASSEMBLY_ACC=CAM_ASM_000201 /LENGTH=128 /DNA_ID=CAMNT_0001592945 /DNA_START=70 /DNA_END=456 /DNA_ORIENTATION=+